MASADSMRAMMRIGGLVEEGEGEGKEGWREGEICRRTSVMNVRSEAEETLGTTMASTLGFEARVVRSSRQ